MLKPLICLSILQAVLALQPDTWQPISVGLMMQQRSLDSCPTEHSHLMKRAHRQSRRDYKQTVESIQRMDAGGILLPGESINGSVNGQGSEIGQARDYHALMSGNGSHPTSGEQHHHHQKKKKKRDEGDGFMSIITWYTGNDLLDPSCITEGKWTPTDESMIAAVTLNWPNKPPCGSFLELRKTKKDPPPTTTPSPTGSYKQAPPRQPRVDSIIVRVMDSCAGCKAGVPHVDLTKAGFRSLYALDIGYVTDIEAKLLSKPPFEKWGKQEEMLYGPEKLGKGSKSSSKGSPTSKNGSGDGPSWTSSHDDSWTSKNTAPAWTPDPSPRVLGGSPTGSSQNSNNNGNNKEKPPKQSGSSSSDNNNGKMSGSVNGGSSGGGGGKGKKGSSEPEAGNSQSQTSPQSDTWRENGWKWGS